MKRTVKMDIEELLETPLTIPPTSRAKSAAGYVLRAVPSDVRPPVGRRKKAAKKAAKKTAKKASKKGRKK